MVSIDIKSKNRKLYDRVVIDESDINLSNITEENTDNWGDNDCIKNVTTISSVDILIKPDRAFMFKDIIDIQMIRYNYYEPAYHLNCSQESVETLSDGSLLIKYR